MATMLRYPESKMICAHCKTRVAMWNDNLCGACSEELEEAPHKAGKCKACDSPHGVWIRRSVAIPSIWIKAGLVSNEEPGFQDARKNVVLENGYCRWCWDKKKVQP